MLTLCWSAKGGSGTTVVAAGIALSAPTPTLLVDLAGGLPVALGLPEPSGPGLADWSAANAPAARLASLELTLTSSVGLLPCGHAQPDTLGTAVQSDSAQSDGARWRELAEWLAAEHRLVVVDAGTRPVPAALARRAAHSLLVTRNCFLGLHAAVASPVRPSGVVLVEEPGRRLDAVDVEHSLGVPVEAVVLVDPAVARAVDAGLLLARLPTTLRRALAPLGAVSVHEAAA
jgi:hypothetical protein